MNQDVQYVQKINQQILDEIDRVCRKYNICYYLDSGTLLGAVRHKGPIPWDDDMDVSFRREEFIKFERVVAQEWKDGRFLLHKPSDFANGKWMDWTNRIIWMEQIMPHAQYIEVGAEAAGKIMGKACVDIFVIDALPKKKFRQKKLFFDLLIDYGLAMGHRTFMDYHYYTVIQRMIIWTLSSVGKRMSMKKIITRYNKHVTKYNNIDTPYCFLGNYSWRTFRIVFRNEWFGHGSRVMFDGKEYCAPANPHEILSKAYGDYMILPPEEERVPQHMTGEKYVK